MLGGGSVADLEDEVDAAEGEEDAFDVCEREEGGEASVAGLWEVPSSAGVGPARPAALESRTCSRH